MSGSTGSDSADDEDSVVVDVEENNDPVEGAFGLPLPPMVESDVDDDYLPPGPVAVVRGQPKPMKHGMGVDVGFANLALCRVEVMSDKSWHIVEWHLIDLISNMPNRSASGMREKMQWAAEQFRVLTRRRPKLFVGLDELGVEEQNDRSEPLQYMSVFSGFILGQIEAANFGLVSAHSKFAGLDKGNHKSYDSTKMDALQQVCALLHETHQDAWLKFLCKFPRKHDLADSLLTALRRLKVLKSLSEQSKERGDARRKQTALKRAAAAEKRASRAAAKASKKR
jgi:hypothetical protein